MLLLLLLPLLGRAQEIQISGRVVDAATKDPIPFSSVRLREAKELVTSDEMGYFQIANTFGKGLDTLTVTAFGYNFGDCCIERNKKIENITVQLVRTAKEKTIKMGPCENFVSATTHPKEEESVIAGLPGTEYAFYFKNEGANSKKTIQAVSLYIGKNGLPKEYFRLFIYKADGANHGPKTNLIPGQMAVYDELRDNTENWCTFYLGDLGITIPEDGYYVAVEFPSQGGGPNRTSFIKNYASTGFIMHPLLEKSECLVWSQKLGGWSNTKEKKSHYILGVWSFLPPHCGNFRRYSSMIKVEVDSIK